MRTAGEVVAKSTNAERPKTSSFIGVAATTVACAAARRRS